MGRMEFGATAPCRTCHGTGKSRNPDWGDKQAARDRSRQRRHGVDVDKPTAIVACVECQGRGYLPVPVADSPRDDRQDLQPSGLPR